MTRKDEIRTISKIAARAVTLAAKHGVEYKQIDAMMDLEAAHEETPIRLEALLTADDGDFAHDVFGIRRHLDRQTRKMGDCFLPRFTAPA